MKKMHFEIIIMFFDIICLAYREQKYIYVKVFDGQGIYFKKLPPPLPIINCSSPNKKGTTFSHSPIILTAILNT